VHTIRGSSKAWPVGTALLRQNPNFRAVLLVEGGPDLLAGFHFALASADVLPVAMLGRSTGSCIDPEALDLLKDRRVRIYPHNDADGGGRAAAEKWAAQLHAVGCRVDFFSFEELTRRDGPPVKDLNDAVLIHPDQSPELSNLLP
jgi:DNA primase